MHTSLKHGYLVLGCCLLLLGTGAEAEYLKTFEGWKVYTGSCIVCHGPQGRGDGSLARKLSMDAPSFRARRSRIDRLSEHQLVSEIQGTSGHLKGMPKWGSVYSPPQLQAVAAYVRYLADSPYPLLGDPVEGQVYYERYCTSCHGARGRGDGFMVGLLKIKPADHTSTAIMDALNNQQMISIIKNGKGMMPAWGGIIGEHYIEELVSYIRLISHSH